MSHTRTSTKAETSPTRSLGDRLEEMARRLDQRTFVVVGVLLLIYVVLLIPSVHRHLWYDELHTLYIAQARSLGEFFDNIRLLDLNPPLTYVLVRASIAAFGPTELATRFPAILGYFLGSMGMFVFIARRAGSLWAAAGVALFWCNEFFYLSAEARPYGVLLACLGLTLVSWDYATDRNVSCIARKWALAGVAAGAAGMLLTHVYAALWIMPFGVAELVRAWRQRRIDWPLWIALTLPLVTCVTYIPLVRNASHAVFPSWFQGSLTRTAAFYLVIFLRVWPALIFTILAAFGLALWRRDEADRPDGRNREGADYQAQHFVFLVAALFPPAILNAFSVMKHVAFYGRYGFPTVLTASLLLILFIAYECRANRLSGLAAAIVLLGFTLLWPAFLSASTGNSLKQPTLKGFDRVHPELPVVANSALTYLEMDHYENSVFVARLYYLVDPNSSIKYTESNLTEGLLGMKEHFPIRANVSSYEAFVVMHRHFLVFGETGRQQGWLLTKLEDEGAQVTDLGLFDSPYADSHLYEVLLHP